MHVKGSPFVMAQKATMCFSVCSNWTDMIDINDNLNWILVREHEMNQHNIKLLELKMS